MKIIVKLLFCSLVLTSCQPSSIVREDPVPTDETTFKTEFQPHAYKSVEVFNTVADTVIIDYKLFKNEDLYDDDTANVSRQSSDGESDYSDEKIRYHYKFEYDHLERYKGVLQYDANAILLSYEENFYEDEKFPENLTKVVKTGTTSELIESIEYEYFGTKPLRKTKKDALESEIDIEIINYESMFDNKYSIESAVAHVISETTGEKVGIDETELQQISDDIVLEMVNEKGLYGTDYVYYSLISKECTDQINAQKEEEWYDDIPYADSVKKELESYESDYFEDYGRGARSFEPITLPQESAPSNIPVMRVTRSGELSNKTVVNNGKITEVAHTTHTFRWNDYGYILEDTEVNSEGEVILTKSYYYDEKHRLTEAVCFGLFTPEVRTQFFYENDFLMEIVEYEDDAVTMRTIYQYEIDSTNYRITREGFVYTDFEHYED